MTLHDLAWLLPRTIGRDVVDDPPLAPAELEVMKLLARRPGLSVGQVAVDLGLQLSNTSAAVRSLVDNGLLERRSTPEDGRVVLLHPTPKAQRQRARRERAWTGDLTRRIEPLPPSQRLQLLAAVPALQALAQALSSPATQSSGR